MHFGHRDASGRGQRDGDQPVAVDEGLEQAIEGVEAAVDAYLDTASSDRRDALVSAIGHLDELVALGDDYTFRRTTTGWGSGVSPGASVLGARDSTPIAEELPTRVLQAQLALVRWAKDALADGGPTAWEALRSAAQDLTSARTLTADGATDPMAVPPTKAGPPPAPPPAPTPPPPAVPPQPGLP